MRTKVLERDEYLCMVCKAAGRVRLAREVDHVVPLHLGGSNAMGNLQGICKPCHKLKTDGEERARDGGDIPF